ncbi:MAG TPA: hypothetical protein VD838_05880 [Anaeromyxobacteraceae bacterium]|nr:hypothetical protein [Anaeromyxobacteraceae bacterium]
MDPRQRMIAALDNPRANAEQIAAAILEAVEFRAKTITLQVLDEQRRAAEPPPVPLKRDDRQLELVDDLPPNATAEQIRARILNARTRQECELLLNALEPALTLQALRSLEGHVREHCILELMPDALRPGVVAIAQERSRQLTEEGWTPEHDDLHENGELAAAAAAYVAFAREQERVGGRLGLEDTTRLQGMVAELWPSAWGLDWWKPSDDPLRNLQKAGAMVAAEIDRIERRRKHLQEHGLEEGDNPAVKRAMVKLHEAQARDRGRTFPAQAQGDGDPGNPPALDERTDPLIDVD